MSEREINERRNWKAEVFPYDYYIPDDSKECLYCLTEKQAEILLGIIQPLAWKTRWYSDSDTPINLDIIEAFRADLTGRLMMACCGDDAIYKYVGTVLYRSDDGGETYYEAPPEDDYRTSSTIWPKPSEVGISTTKCQNADSVVATFRDQMIQSVNNDMGYAAILGVIVAVILFFASAGSTAAISAQIAALVGAIFTAGVASWKAAFTSDVWDDFRCLIFNNMTDDESIDQAGFNAIYAAIDTKFTGIVVPTLKGYLQAAGLVGILNMMRSGSGDSDADCSGCTACPVEWDIGNVDGNIALGTRVSVSGNVYVFQSQGYSDGAYYLTVMTPSESDCCSIISIEAEPGYSLPSTGTDGSRILCGASQHVGNITYGSLLYTVGNLNYFAFNSSNAFRIKVTFG